MGLIFYRLFFIVLRNHPKWRANKNEHGEGAMLIQIFVLKVINIKRNIFAYPEKIDLMAE